MIAHRKGFLPLWTFSSKKYLTTQVNLTTHFIQTLEELGKIPTGAILATLDVSSLYTNIPNGEGIRSMGKVLEAFRPNGLKPTNTSLLCLLTLVLWTNNFTFCGKPFLQVGRYSYGNQGCTQLCYKLYALLGEEIRLRQVWRPVPLEKVYKRHLPDLTDRERFIGGFYPIFE